MFNKVYAAMQAKFKKGNKEFIYEKKQIKNINLDAPLKSLSSASVGSILLVLLFSAVLHIFVLFEYIFGVIRKQPHLIKPPNNSKDDSVF